MYAKTFALIGGLASMANAHIKMSSPVPYGASSLSNAPLDPSGSDFPCKQRNGVYDAEGASNVYELGSSGNELAFIGSAVHGGGSCQVSITYDAQPDKNSVWKVIKSIEGGCPAQDTEGNLGDNANMEVPYKYSFDIPEDIPAGNGTIAWTWFNKVGNREMYMNCAPVTLTGNGGSETTYQSLPDMLVANIGTGCGTSEGTDVQFPDAGEYVERLNGATDVFKGPEGSCGPTGTPGNGGGNGGNGGNSPAPTTAPEPTQAPTPTGGAGGDNSDDSEEDATTTPPLGGIFKPVPTTEAAAPQPTDSLPIPEQGNGGSEETAPPVESAPVEAPVESPVEAPVDTPVQEPPTGGNGAETVGSPCSNEGEWNCVGGSSFQRCASGSWSSVMQLSGGTSCQPGLGANINMIVTRNGRTRPVRFRSA